MGEADVKNLAGRVIRLMAGLFLISLATVMTCQAGLGIAPWDVLHQGISKILPISMGQASIVLGLLILAADVLARERIGVGTVLNLVFVGLFMDAINLVNSHVPLIPEAETLLGGFILLLLSFPFMSFGMYLYMAPRLGAGPRDSMMVALKRRLPVSVGLCRLGMEAVALLIGWMLGGTVGIGTVLLVLCNGPAMQLCFKILHFNVTEKPNESLGETLELLRKPREVAG